MKPTKTAKVGKLTVQRTVACPTCHSPIGEFCKSVGARGKVAGAVMKTSCHNARITAAGLPLRDFSKSHKPAKPAPMGSAKAKANKKRSEAMKLSWKRRKADALKGAIASIPTPFVPTITHTRKDIGITTPMFIQSVLNMLDAGAMDVTIELEGVGKIHAKPIRNTHLVGYDDYKYQLIIG